MSEYEDDQFEEYSGPSKSQIKREMHALQELGKRICELPKKQLKTLPLTATMIEAVAEWDRIKKNEAKRRHLQYIGRVMRSEDVESVQLALDKQDPSSEEYNRVLHQQEKWRDRLITGGKDALSEFCDQFDVTDIQHLRQLIRNAAKEHEDKEANPDTHQAKMGKSAARKLFLFIKTFYPTA
ncbi:ribosome biogenesis factor YjgA [Pseudomonas sp. HK3]|jgi:ribosome-associated protein